MAGFDNGVSAPGGMSYAAPLMQFQQFSNWAADDPYKKVFDQQQQQLNQQRLQQGQQSLDIAGTFKGGLPVDPQTGTIDYKKAVSMLAQKGDINALWNGADAMLSQSATNQSPMLTGGTQPPAGAPPASSPARPLTPAPANSPQGDPGSGTVVSLVTDRLPNQDATTGQMIAKVAQTMGVDPNATLTPGQLRRAQGLLQRYAPQDPAGGGEGSGSKLPPSANAVSAAPKAAPPPSAASAQPAAAVPFSRNATPPVAGPPQQVAQPAPIGAGSPAPIAAPPSPQPPPPTGGPVTPQVPLPKGFTDPQQAILALRAEAGKYATNPKARGQVAALDNWAQRIEESIKPVSVGPNTTLLDAKSGKPLYQAGAQNSANEETLNADAERYRQTGTLPPNMGRGIQGTREAAAIRARATEQEINAGGDPAKWSDRWQEFRAKGVGKSTAERVKANREENLDIILRATEAAIPAALEASKALPRSDFVPLNKIIQNGQVNTSNPRLVEFGMANLQLAEHWARAMNPTGVMRESDREKALHFLSISYGNNTYESAVRQLEKQIKREKTAVREGKSTVSNGADPVPGAVTETTPSGFTWSIVK